jgi:hypothetical protein
MIRSIGYEGFAKASVPGGTGGFVIYSGSVQPLLNASEQYSGVGIELFANTASYFKYTTSGSGLLDIKTETFFLGGQNQYISGSNGNIIISSSNFSINQQGNTAMSGDVNAVTGVFQNVAITGVVISGSGTAFSKATGSGDGAAYLLESWFTSSFERNKAAGTSSAATTTKFATGLTFSHGIFGWTASAALSSSADSYGFQNPLGTGYNMVGAKYYRGSLFEVKNNNPGPPYNFRQWKDIVTKHSEPWPKEYNGYGNEITTSMWETGEGPYFVPPVDTIIFLSPKFNEGPYSITSSLITIPSASLGLAFDPNVSDDVYNATPLGLQFSMRMIAGRYSGSVSPAIGWFKWTTNSTYKTYYGQVEIVDETGTVLITERKYFNGTDDWQTWNIPLTPALAETFSGGINIYNKFKIILSWEHSLQEPFAGRFTPKTNTNLIRITELRLVQYPTTLGLKTDSIQFGDSFLTTGNSGTQHFGAFYPIQDDTYDIGIDRQKWKSIYVNTSSLGRATIGGGIKNPTTDYLGYDNKDSLIVWDGLSDVNNEIYNPALKVEYSGVTRHANMVTVGAIEQSYGIFGSYGERHIGNLYVSGTIGFSLPAEANRNGFSGEETIVGEELTSTALTIGDIYFLKYTLPFAGDEFNAIWEKASAANVSSGSGMLGIFNGRPDFGTSMTANLTQSPGRGMGLRGVARFSGSSYYSINSGSGAFPGDKLYLSTTPGKFQRWAPTGSGEVSRIIGYVYSDAGEATDSSAGGVLAVGTLPGTIYFAPETSWIENV